MHALGTHELPVFMNTLMSAARDVRYVLSFFQDMFIVMCNILFLREHARGPLF